MPSLRCSRAQETNGGSRGRARSRCTRQVRRSAAAGDGRGRYTLWTGDLGTALYLADCIDGGGRLPLP